MRQLLLAAAFVLQQARADTLHLGQWLRWIMAAMHAA